MNVKPGLEVASLTDIGCQRENNEDSFLYWEPTADGELQRKGSLAVIADGMGGYEGGQEASRLAVETVREVYDNVVGDDPHVALREAFARAHERIQSYAGQHPALHGMGGYEGGQEASRLAVETGIVRAEDAEKHPQRHILTAALGAGIEVAVQSAEQAMALQDSDYLLLCTDGLWGVVSDEELEAAVKGNSPAGCCAVLVKLALQRGGPDNITVQVLRVLPESESKPIAAS